MTLFSKLKPDYFIIVSVFIGIITTLLNYTFGNNDHIEQLPIIYKFINTDYLINDFFVNSNSGFSPRYYYTNLIAFFVKFINLPLLFFLGTLLSNIVISICMFLCGNLLFNDRRSNILAVILIMTLPIVSLGSDLVLFSSMFTPTTLAFPLILISFYFFLKKKIFYSLLITGFVSLFHVLIGFEFGILFLATSLLTDIFQKKDWISIGKKASLLLVIILFLLPNVIPYFQNNSFIDKNEFITILAYYRHPHHYILSEILTLKESLKFVGFSFVFFVAYKKWLQKSPSSYLKISSSILITLLALGIVANWIFIEIIPTKLFTTLQLLRLLNIVKFIFILVAANYLVKTIEEKVYDLKSILLLLIIILLVVYSEVSVVKIIVTLVLFLALVFIGLKTRKAVSFTLFSLAIVATMYANQIDNVSLKKYQKSYLSTSLNSNKQNLSDFIRKNTDKQSVFLTPHNFGFIRTESKRAIVVDFKAFPFQNNAMLEWYQRIEKCYGLAKHDFERNYRNIDDQKILVLKELYNFDYAILYKDTFSKFPVIFADSEYKIIDLTSHAQ